jgi:hypothetical protein
MVLDPFFPKPEMPCTARASAANSCYHVLNRGNHRAQVFHKDDDYQAFVNLLMWVLAGWYPAEWLGNVA